MKKLCFIMSLLVALCLAGCGGQAADNSAGEELFVYVGAEGSGLAKADGSMVVEPGDYEFGLVYDLTSGRQSYAEQIVSIRDEEALNQYGEPLLLGRTFNFYDTEGKLIKTATVELEAGGDDGSIVCYQSPDGSLDNARILVNELIVRGKYKVLDTDGNMLLDARVLPPYHCKYSYVYLVLSESVMVVDYSYYGEDWLDGEHGLFFWDISGEGEPLTMAQDYTGMGWLYDEMAQRYSGYYMANYEDEEGYMLTDVLDGQGQVVLSGLSELYSMNNGLFTVEKDGVHGIMNRAGEWVYQEQPVG